MSSRKTLKTSVSVTAQHITQSLGKMAGFSPVELALRAKGYFGVYFETGGRVSFLTKAGSLYVGKLPSRAALSNDRYFSARTAKKKPSWKPFQFNLDLVGKP